jgi:hypothetical protein
MAKVKGITANLKPAPHWFFHAKDMGVGAARSWAIA